MKMIPNFFFVTHAIMIQRMSCTSNINFDVDSQMYSNFFFLEIL